MYQSKLKSPATDALFRAILALRNEEECYRFFEDICTVNEIRAIAQRWEVAGMLDGGNTFNAIVQKTGASTATISRVNRCLNWGAGGYKKMLAREKGQEENT